MPKNTQDNRTKAKKNSSKSRKPSTRQIRAYIIELANKFEYDENILLEFAEFINGGKLKEAELSMQELKTSVCQAFNCKDYSELKNNENFKLYVSDMKLKLNTKSAWQEIYREWVGFPESEKNSIGYGCINGVDIFRNFHPWAVFQLDPNLASEEDIKTAFRKLAMKYHPDQGGDRKIFEQLQKMRDSLLAAF